MPCGKWSIRRRYGEWLLRCRTWCASWIRFNLKFWNLGISNFKLGEIVNSKIAGWKLKRNYFMSGINPLRPDGGSTHKTKRIGRVRAADMEKRQGVEVKACGRVREAAKSAASRAVRCLCTGACPSAASRMRGLKKSSRS